MKKAVRRLEQGPKFNLAIIAVLAVFCTLVGIVIMSSRAATAVVPSSIYNQATCDANMPDVTRALQDFFTGLPNGTVVQFPSNRCYRTEGYLQVSSTGNPKTNLTIEGNGSKLQAFTDGCQDQSNDGVEYNHCLYGARGTQTPGAAVPGGWPRTRFRLNIERATNITIRNLKLDGGHPNAGPEGTYDPDLEAQHAFNFDNTTGGLVENSRADRVWGDYVYIGGGNTNITVRNNVFGEDNGAKSGNGRQGMAIHGSNVHVENNRIMNVRRTHIDIEPGGGGTIKDIFIDNNVFGRSHLNWFSNHSFGTANPIIENIYFRNNKLEGDPFAVDSVPPVEIESIDEKSPAQFRRRNYQFINNVTNQGGASGNCQNPGKQMRFWGIDGLLVQGNYAIVSVSSGIERCQHLLETAKVRNARIIGNSILRGKATALRYYESFNVCERDNKVGEPLKPDPINAAATLCDVDNLPSVSNFTVNPTSVTVGQTVNLSASASDDKGIQFVDFYRGFNLIARDTTAPYAASLNTSGLTLGNHNLFAKATDTASQSKDSNIVRLVINAAGTTTTPGGTTTGTGGSKTGSSIIPGPVGSAIDKVADVLADIPVIGSVVPQIEETIEQLSEGRPWLKPLLGSVFLGIGLVLLLVIAFVVWRKLRRWRKSKEPPKLGGSGSEQIS